MKIACATDDGINFISRHFGDANYYYIFELIDGDFVYVDKITNNSEEEKQHADPVKAKSIVKLLKEQNVDVGLAKVFGPNILRIKNIITPVIVSVDDIQSGLMQLKKSYSQVKEAAVSKEYLKIK
ncbi:MAG: NifB/NifX family molybdenum-iron cluster-binding protein [Eubacteriales bacterium]